MKQIHKDYQQAFLLEKTKLDRLLDVIHACLVNEVSPQNLDRMLQLYGF